MSGWSGGCGVLIVGGGGLRERRGGWDGGCGGGWGEELARCLWFFVDMFLVEVGFGAIPRGFCLRCGL